MQLHNIFVVWHNEQAQNRHLSAGTVTLLENFHSFSSSRLASKAIMNGQKASIHQSLRPSFKLRQFKAHSSSPAEKIWSLKIKICRETEHLKTKIRRNGNSYSCPVISNRPMRKGLMADQHTVTFHTACKSIPAAKKRVFPSYLQVLLLSMNSFSFLMPKCY